ncbi:MAG TPA: nucleotidyltransferase family protein [Acidimicrobiales bacterium]|nr:nucleotidyltransferase family protein [Acidimicrobiales bacterium]
MSTAGVLLAAGRGSRFKGEAHKLLVPFRGRPLVSWAIDAVMGAGLDDVFVVTGKVVLGHDLIPEPARIVHNPLWVNGLASSLQVGLAAAEERDHDAVVVGLGDQPLIPVDAWRAVAASESSIAVATYEGQRRNPVRLHRSVWKALPTVGDEGARILMRERPDLVSEVPCGGEPADVDTLEDLDTWS